METENSINAVNEMSHLTITTGHMAKSLRRAVPDQIINKMREWLEDGKREFIPGQSGEVLAKRIPGCEGYWATLKTIGDSLLVSVIQKDVGLALTFGVAANNESGGDLWCRLGSETKQPAAPWCAVNIDLGFCFSARTQTKLIQDLQWFADFERCVAWAWLAHLGGRQTQENVWPLNESCEAKEKENAAKIHVEKSPSIKNSCNEEKSSAPREGAVFDYDECGPRLRIFYPDPTQREIQDVRTGVCKFKLITIGSVIFILSKFGNENWMDAPYSIHLVPAALRKLNCEFQEGKRYGMLVRLIDSTTGHQCGARVVTWSPHFSALFHGCVKSQLDNPFNERRYDEEVKKIYGTKSINQLVKQAYASTKGGA
jgi:hypothetical protein